MGEGQGKRTAIDSHASIDRLIARSDQHPIAIALVFIVFAPSMEALFVIGITAHFTVPLLLQPPARPGGGCRLKPPKLTDAEVEKRTRASEPDVKKRIRAVER
jgi:hypothetical protein